MWRSCTQLELWTTSNSLKIVSKLTCDVLQTGVGQFATGGQVEVLEFDQAGQDRQPGV